MSRTGQPLIRTFQPGRSLAVGPHKDRKLRGGMVIRQPENRKVRRQDPDRRRNRQVLAIEEPGSRHPAGPLARNPAMGRHPATLFGGYKGWWVRSCRPKLSWQWQVGRTSR